MNANGSPSHRWYLAVIIALSVLTSCLYLPTLSNEFVYDDRAIVLNDDYLHSPRNMLDILTLRIFSRDMMDYNRPFYVLTTMVDYLIWGANPLGYHLANNLLHVCNVVLLFLWLLDMLRSGVGRLEERRALAGAMIGAVLYAVHPINTEAVACATYREDLLVALFTLSSLLLTRHFTSASRRVVVWSAAAVVICAVGAIGSKESGLVLPAALLALWWFRGRKEPWRPWLAAVGCSTVVVATFTMVSSLMRFKGDSVVYWVQPAYAGGSFVKMLEIVPSVFAVQMRQILLPYDLSAAYGWDELLQYPLAVALPVLAVLAALCIWGSVRSRLFTFCFVLFLILYAPVSTFMPKYQIAADRFLYVPMVAVSLACAMAAAWTWGRLGSRIPAMLFVPAFVLVCVLYGFVSYGRLQVWHNERTLWSDVIRRSPRMPIAHDCLGYAFLEGGLLERAAYHFEMELQLTQGKSPDAYTGFALIYAQAGRWPRARECMAKAGALDPRFQDAERLRQSLRWTGPQIKLIQQILAHPGT